MQSVADSIRTVTAMAQQRFHDGERSAAIDLLDAAKALLEARDDQMVTSAEWDRLGNAVDAAG